jgi:hypothetical protein
MGVIKTLYRSLHVNDYRLKIFTNKSIWAYLPFFGEHTQLLNIP